MMKILLKFTISLIIPVLMAACTDTYLGRLVRLRGVDVEDYKSLPSRPVETVANATPFSEKLNRNWMTPILEQFDRRDLSKQIDFDKFAASTGTTAFIILQNGKLIDERYYNGYRRDSLFKSFSISKSVLSALFGVAQADGLISRSDPIGKHIEGIRNPALAKIPLAYLLDNISGFAYQRGNAPWKQQPRMYYSTDIRAYLRRISIASPPGTKFEGEDLSPLIVGLALESALKKRDSKATLSDFASHRLWKPMGAQFDAIWNMDHPGDGLEKVESGFTARAIDLARFGQLYLDGGKVNGNQIIPAEWVVESTTAPLKGSPNYFTDGHYRNLWWGDRRIDNQTQRYFANGHFGQRIYIVPDKRLVIMRLGRDNGGIDWTALVRIIGEKWRG